MLVKVLGTLFVVGFVHPFYWWCAALVVVGWVAYRGYLTAAAELEQRRLRAMRLREALDRQDRWYIEGDPRGTYGEVAV